MPKKLNSVSRSGNDIKGIQHTDFMALDDFRNCPDPLASGAATANKPASSIPSMFARLMFFRTAFFNVSTAPKVKTTVYAKFVSDSLDLYEMLFSHNADIKIIRWDKQTQINNVKAIGNHLLAQALETQANKFIPNITDIYLFEKDGVIIGGTSPFTLVYTSPNWNNQKPARTLTERNEKFREFMYKFAAAFQSVPELKYFVSYIQNSKKFDPIYGGVDFDGKVAPVTLEAEYPPIKIIDNNGQHTVVIDPVNNLKLYARDSSHFQSDFFIDSHFTKGPIDANSGKEISFDDINTPLFLTQDSLSGLIYDDAPIRPLVFVETELENGDQIERPLPNSTYKHRWLSKIYFIEEKLLVLPYAMNTAKFKNAIVIEGGKRSCLLPLKPMFFKYFDFTEMDSIITVNVDDIQRNVTVMLDIPVRDQTGTRKNKIRIQKVYNYDTDLISICGLEPAYNLGIFPFYKNNKHYVLKQDKANLDSTVAFHNLDKLEAQAVKGTVRTDNAYSRSTYYTLNSSFDYIRVTWNGNSAVVIPEFTSIVNGAKKYYYGVDFGTTNTHIAYSTDVDATATSFDGAAYKIQVGWLSPNGDCGDSALTTTADQEFIPINSNDSFTFPIRTAVAHLNALAPNSKLFEDVSIGFRYSKEFALNPIYHTELKWKFDSGVSDTQINERVKAFCLELTWVIKNHWMEQTDAQHNGVDTPEIWLTYPLIMSNWSALKNVWIDCYEKVFDVTQTTAKTHIKELTESLAPCQKVTSIGGAAATGILNIDMGGGSTDFQYYKQKNDGSIDSFYNSILFAGDDLWGKCYEHVPQTNIGVAIKDNEFTRFADLRLQAADISVGDVFKKVSEIKFNDPKEKINCLLKDPQHFFADALRRAENNTCRKIMYLHYTAILWHVSKWMVANGITEIPQNISFTGLASKYLDLLFDNDDRFNAFTSKALSLFSGLNANAISITKEESPKNITAEGAAMYAKEAVAPPVCLNKHHLGYDSYKSGDTVEYAHATEKKQVVMDSIRSFLSLFNSIGDCGGVLTPDQVLILTDTEVENFLKDASVSFDQMLVFRQKPGQNVQESMFFWAFKDSLWKLH